MWNVMWKWFSSHKFRPWFTPTILQPYSEGVIPLTESSYSKPNIQGLPFVNLWRIMLSEEGGWMLWVGGMAFGKHVVLERGKQAPPGAQTLWLGRGEMLQSGIQTYGFTQTRTGLWGGLCDYACLRIPANLCFHLLLSVNLHCFMMLIIFISVSYAQCIVPI